MMFFSSVRENVRRQLEGLEIKPTFWCRVGIHTWGKWSLDDKRISVGYTIYLMERECDCCGDINTKRKRARYF